MAETPNATPSSQPTAQPDPNNVSVAGTNPVQVDTQSTPVQGQLQDNTPAAQAPPDATPKPGSFFGHLSHAFMGAVLGGLAGKQEVEAYHIDPDTGKQTPVYKTLHPREQLSRIAGAALRGLAAGSMAPDTPGHGADWASGMGAGAAAQQKFVTGRDDRLRQQAQTEFQNEQSATLHKLNNAHILLETLKARQDLLNADLETNQKFANVGADQVAAMTASGKNNVVGPSSIPESEVPKFREDHPEYINFTPLVTKVEPATDDKGQPVLDPVTGAQKINRYVTFVDMKDKVPLSQNLIDELKTVGMPGADSLKAGQEVEPQQWAALHFQWLKKYNEANNDPKNIEIKESNVNGRNIWFSHNKVTDATHAIINPIDRQPMEGKMPDTTETDQVFMKGVADGKYKNDANGRIQAAAELAGKKAAEEEAARMGVDAGNAGDRAEMARALVEHDADPSQLTKRAKDYNMRLIDADNYSMQTYGKHFDLAKAQSDYKFASEAGTKNTLNFLNSVMPSLTQLVQQSDRIPRTNYPAINDVLDWERLAKGNPAVAAYHTTILETADQVAKILQGGGTGNATSDAKLKQSSDLFNAGFSSDSIRAIANDLLPLLNNRKSAMIGNNAYLQKWYGMQAAPASEQNLPPLQSLHSNGTVTIGWDGKNWVDSKTRQPYTSGGK